MQSMTITVRVPATFEGARDAATTVREFLDALSLPARQSSRLELVLAESVNNVVEHAGCGQEGSVDISVDADGDTLRLVVSDEGLRTNPDGLNNFMSRPELPGEISDDDRGIVLIRRIMDEAVYSREQNRNVLKMTAKVGGGDQSPKPP